MERTFHILLYRAFHAQHNALRPYLTKLGLGFGQPKILAFLLRNGASSQRQLADYYDVDPAAVCRMLDSLQTVSYTHLDVYKRQLQRLSYLRAGLSHARHLLRRSPLPD